MKSSYNYRHQDSCKNCRFIEFHDGVFLCTESQPKLPAGFVGYGQLQMTYKDITIEPTGICDLHSPIFSKEGK